MLIDWASLAILSAALLGVVHVVDSHLITRRMPSLRAYMLPLGLAVLVFGLVVTYLFPLPESLAAGALTAAIASGILRTTSLGIVFYTLKTEEVSRVIPVVHTYPVFVAIMAVPLLGEALHYLEWLAIVIVVAGVVMVSVRLSPGNSVPWFSKKILLLVGSSLFMATADVASKYALGYLSFWNMFAINNFCLAAVFLLISLRPCVLKELANLRQGKAVAFVVVNEILAALGMLLLFWAMQRGPVSLVSTIVSSRPIFVFIYVLALSRISPAFLVGHADRRTQIMRLIGIMMIFSGIAIIYLS